MKHVIVNLAVFKATWTAIVISAAAGAPIIGVIAVAIAVGIHLWLCDNAESEIRLLLIAAAIGLAWESVLVFAGLLEYSSGTWAPGAAPVWIVAMWVLFATTINVGMRWLRRNMTVASIVGAVGGPLAFLAGSGLGAVEFPSTTLALICIGIGWAVLLPLLVQIAIRLDRNHPMVEQAA